MTVRSDLADRVEALKGADREVDREIFATIHSGPEWMHLSKETQGVWASHYTAFFDAAIALVPEGWATFLATEDRHSHSWRWQLRGGYGWKAAARAATPALALTAAALRARDTEAGR